MTGKSTPGKLKRRDIDKIVPYASNARLHPQEQIDLLMRSIERFGFVQPILIDAKGVIIAGHGRLTAARLLGMTSVPVLIADEMSDEDMRAYRLADNRLAELSSWDKAILHSEVESLKADGYDLEDAGFLPHDVGRMTGESTGREDVVPETPKVPVSGPGNIWKLGRHRLLCGNSLDAEAVKAFLGHFKPGLLVTDPPYGVGYDPKWRCDAPIGVKGTRNVNRVAGDEAVKWGMVFDGFKPDVAYVWAPSINLVQFAQAVETGEYQIRSMIVWAKQVHAISQGHYHWQHEICLYGVRKGRQASWIGGRDQTTLWQIKNLSAMDTSQDPADGKRGHSTQKPIECMERPIKNHKGDVFDPFVGSGTTLIAAERQCRTCYAVELDPRYVDVCIERWQEFTGEKAVKEG